MDFTVSRKIVPVATLALSLAYFPYLLGQDRTRMIGDELGGDPGGFVLPAFLAAFMLLVSVYLLFGDRASASRKGKTEGREKKLIALALSILYIVLFQWAGFIIVSVSLIFSLSFVASVDSPLRKNLWTFVLGLSGSIAFQIGLYSVGRVLTRNLFLIGRANSFTIASSPFFVFSANIAALGVIFAIVAVLSLKVKIAGGGKKAALVACLTAVGSTEFLFLVFRQLFLVNLARGLITW